MLAALALSGCVVAVDNAAPATAPVAPAPAVPTAYQWLHGSGEAAILARQTFAAMADFVRNEVGRRRSGHSLDSVVLAEGASLDDPRYIPCADKPAAVIFDIDETALLNTGANYDSVRRGAPPFDAARWAAWERAGAALVEPMPGLADALGRMRALGVTIVFNSNRDTAYGAETADALRRAGLGEARPGETLFLRGDVAPGSGKDPRRRRIAERYCVLAMAGDQLGDFADAYNDAALSVRARRRLAETAPASQEIGEGWFLLANPAYGPGVRGTVDDLFPADKRWPGPATP